MAASLSSWCLSQLTAPNLAQTLLKKEKLWLSCVINFYNQNVLPNIQRLPLARRQSWVFNHGYEYIILLSANWCANILTLMYFLCLVFVHLLVFIILFRENYTVAITNNGELDRDWIKKDNRKDLMGTIVIYLADTKNSFKPAYKFQANIQKKAWKPKLASAEVKLKLKNTALLSETIYLRISVEMPSIPNRYTECLNRLSTRCVKFRKAKLQNHSVSKSNF